MTLLAIYRKFVGVIDSNQTAHVPDVWNWRDRKCDKKCTTIPALYFNM